MLQNFRPIEAADVAGRTVLARVDLNVPMAKGEVSDATRIELILPLVRDLSARGARTVLMSHFGRPGGKPVAEMSLRPVAAELARLLPQTSVVFVEASVGDQARAAVSRLGDGEVLVLENLRFHEGEEANDPDFAGELAALGDIYVNDAFSCAHRAHASTEALARLLPAYVGPAMAGELQALQMALELPKRPVAAIIGGAKVSSKITVLTNLVPKVNMLVIGGGMANTFLLAKGDDVGRSLAEPDHVNTVGRIISRASETGCRIVLPGDAVVAPELREGAPSEVRGVNDIPGDAMILDIGPQSVADLKTRLGECRTVLWNGPLGAFEIAPFGEATFEVAREVARLTRERGLISVAGGGDTVAALNAAGVTGDFTYVSSAGGAFLEWLEGRELPGIAVLAKA